MPSILSTLTLLIAGARLALAATTTAAAPATFTFTPTPGQTYNNWAYLGCYIESPGRILTGKSSSNDTMTIESCQSFCLQNNFRLAGVEYGRECYCGSRLVQGASFTTQSTCNMKCKGNAQQTCGGTSRVSVFNSTTFAGPKPPKTVGSWTYDSCYMEPQYGRALTSLVKADDAMTVSTCVNACQAAGYAVAGLEYGRECWCGASKPGGLEDASDPNCAMQCDMVCGGDPTQICGGSGAITLYQKNKGRSRVRDAKEYHDHGHGPVGVGVDLDVDAAARKSRFLKVRRPALRKET